MSNQKVTQVLHTTQEDLIQSITNGLEEKLNSLKEHFQPKEPCKWITRREVSKILSISIVTVDDWTKKGILTAYRIGNQKRFKRAEVENALTKIAK